MSFKDLFKKKKSTTNEQLIPLIKDFWKWFEENENWIIETSKNDGSNVVYAIDEKLKPLFPNFTGELEFDFCFFEGKGEFNFFDLKKKYLNEIAQIIKSQMPQVLAARWEFNISN